MKKLLNEFRLLQRVKDVEEWEPAKRKFLERVDELCQEFDNEDSAERIKRYFVQNWLDPFWMRKSVGTSNKSGTKVLHTQCTGQIWVSRTVPPETAPSTPTTGSKLRSRHSRSSPREPEK
jgi:hypothetical protein